jgi:hypothetical protein
VKGIRALGAAVAFALVGALLAPAAGAVCEARQHRCPGMPPELAKLCHQGGARMAPDCCQQDRQVPERRSANETAAPALPSELPASATTVAAADAAELRVAAGDFSRDGSLHALGLFTLHAVFRI